MPRCMTTEARAEPDQRDDAAEMRRRTRIARIVVSCGVILIALGITASLLSRVATQHADQHYRTYATPDLGVNYIAVRVDLEDVDPSGPYLTANLTFMPHGSYLERDGESLSRPLEVQLDDVAQGGRTAFVADRSMEPVQADLDLQGDSSSYPFDSYTTPISVEFFDVGPAGSPQPRRVVPIKLEVDSETHDWAFSYRQLSSYADGSLSVRVDSSRGPTMLAFAVFELLLMIALCVIAATVVFFVITGRHKLEFSLFGWLAGLLFALPAIRNTMPGSPGLGTIADDTVFFWGLLVLAVCFLTVGVTWVRRTARANHESVR